MPDRVIGIALGSGIARGWAHVGALRVLRAEGIVPDIVCGTSIGALVGAAYVAGRMAQLERWARFTTRLPPIQRLGLRARAAGMGNRVALRLLGELLADVTFNQLPCRLVCVATNLHDGSEVWLQEGRIVDAVRASCSLPGFFPPVQVGDHLLVDGALVNPIPTSACRALGANVTIAISLSGGPLEGPVRQLSIAPTQHDVRLATDGRSTSKLRVIARSARILQNRLHGSCLSNFPPEITICPAVGSIGYLQFCRAEEAIAAGEKAVKQHLDRIREAINAN